MASNYHSYQPEKKISAGDGPKLKKQGGAASMPQKQSYTGCKLPGPASHGVAGLKKGAKEISGYAAYNGLSQSSGGGGTSFKQGNTRDEQRGVFESVMDAEGVKSPMARSVGRVEYRGAMQRSNGDFTSAMNNLGGKAKTSGK